MSEPRFRVANRKLSMADLVRALMHKYRYNLAANEGNPPQGKCLDCKRDIRATEIAIKCDRCNEFVCVDCVNKHDHLHAQLVRMGFEMVPN